MDKVHQNLQPSNPNLTVQPKLGSLFKIGDRHYHTTVSEYDNELRVHIRKYYELSAPTQDPSAPMIPTKYGIALNLKEWTDLMAKLNSISCSINKLTKETSFLKRKLNSSVKAVKIGDRDYFVRVCEYNNELRVDIRKYFEESPPPPGCCPMEYPTKYGIALNMKEWADLLEQLSVLNTIIEENNKDNNLDQTSKEPQSQTKSEPQDQIKKKTSKKDFKSKQTRVRKYCKKAKPY